MRSSRRAVDTCDSGRNVVRLTDHDRNRATMRRRVCSGPGAVATGVAVRQEVATIPRKGSAAA